MQTTATQYLEQPDANVPTVEAAPFREIVTKTELLKSDTLAPGHTYDRVKAVLYALDEHAWHAPLDVSDHSVTLAFGGEQLKLYLRRAPSGMSGHQRAVERVRANNASQQAGGSHLFYHSSESVAALTRIFDRTMPSIPDTYVSATAVLREIAADRSFHGIRKAPSETMYTKLWQAAGELADEAHQRIHGVSSAARFEKISGLGAKPENWPAAEEITIEMQGHNLTFILADGPRMHSGPCWYLHGQSEPAMQQLFNDYEKQQQKSGLSLAAIAEELGIHQRQNKGAAQGSWRESTSRDYYKDLTGLVKQLVGLADALTNDETTAEIDVPYRDLKFSMVRSSAGKWQLSRDSLPSVRALLGLSPSIGSSQDATDGAGSRGPMDHASRSDRGWQRE